MLGLVGDQAQAQGNTNQNNRQIAENNSFDIYRWALVTHKKIYTPPIIRHTGNFLKPD